jgi:hypothetical protein
MLERKEKTQRRRERGGNITRETGCQWRSGNIKSKRKMDECRAERKGQRHRQARKKGKNQIIQIQQELWEVYDRRNSWVPGGTWREREERQLSTRGMDDVAKCERERKTRGEILKEDGREIRWMMEEEGKNRRRDGR